VLYIGIEFIICVFLIIASGTRLCTFGDVIAERTGLGRTWVGVLLIAAVTSLPELITTASCASLVNVPDMAVGIIFGSCVFNLMIIVLLDFFQGPGPIFLRAHRRHIQTILLSIFLSGLAMFAIFIKEPIHFYGIGLTNICIVILYLTGMRKILKAEQEEQKEHESQNNLNNSAGQEEQYDKASFRKAVKGFVLSAVVIIFASVWISFVGEKIAIATGMKENFVGNIFLALATSLPEVVV